jgi:hypothetical protein
MRVRAIIRDHDAPNSTGMYHLDSGGLSRRRRISQVEVSQLMSLTTETLHRLRAKEFDKLYTDHEAKWKEAVENASTYVQTYIKGKDKVRPADVAEALRTSVKIDPDFEQYVIKHNLKQKYWVNDFVDYIIDQIYPPADVVTEKKQKEKANVDSN